MNSNFSQIVQYESDEEMVNENNQVQDSIKKRRKYKVYTWVKDIVFNNKEDALKYIDNENQWGHYFTNYTKDGKKAYYRRNKVRYRTTQCSARICLFYDANNDDVVLFRSDEIHTHQNIKTISKISIEIKTEINKLIEFKLKPKAILESLHGQRRYGQSIISLGQLEQWCIDCNLLPENDDEAFVTSYEFMYDEEEDDDDVNNTINDPDENNAKFRIFISTKRLLKLALNATKIHADATYRLIWQGFPVLIVGTTGLGRLFHPFGMAICSNEKTKDLKFIFESLKKGVEKINEEQYSPIILISDASNAIRNAFEMIFGKRLLIMCWAHMRRNVISKIQ
ncbi:unnamed protein product [Rotaria socialis]|uniref:MULE transposase domain-containing protein n=1 Tax=Rotaria socialis TaxID=392032 RepID=A0A818JIG0_9BILA|nr:unnamed protein product [Rotaria socialis]CAF3442064.1 unnamed protein product [Rotaria socialis]CAF3543371.1 unnamed protein product [Rotaria socialis]CAF4461556.1 unnamed protein product [Rotaria socialis]CAF4525596.1 unnamed protein product [Rotaria socialis]